MVSKPTSRILDTLLAVIAAVAITVGSLWLEPAPAAAARTRTAAIAVELQAVALGAGWAGTGSAGAAATEAVSGQAAGDQPMAAAVGPADIGDIANLAVTVAGAALWYAAFPITLPATMIGASLLYAIAGYFACFCFNFPPPDQVLIGGLSTFFEIPKWAVQNAIAALQPVQSAPAATVRAVSGAGTPPPPVDPAVGGRVPLVAPEVSEVSEVSAESAEDAVRPAGRRGKRPVEPSVTKARVRPAAGTSLPAAVAVGPAAASPAGAAGTPAKAIGPRSRAPRLVSAGRG